MSESAMNPFPFWISHRFLGRMINLASDERNSFEIFHRKQVVWHAFHKYSRTLCNQNISLKKRLRLFDACVSPVILFGAAVLPLTWGEIINYDVIQKKMLRKIIGWERLEEDDWHELMAKMKFKMIRAMQIHHIHLWSEHIFQSQWRYFHHLCSKSFDHIGMTAYR